MQMVESPEDMLFAYDKKEDLLYFSAGAQEILGFPDRVRRYWKESPYWNRVSQKDQENMVNLLRLECRSGRYAHYDVPLRMPGGRWAEEQKECRIEMKCLWDEEDMADFISVTGKITLRDRR